MGDEALNEVAAFSAKPDLAEWHQLEARLFPFRV
jgi:hypothetical protein